MKYSRKLKKGDQAESTLRMDGSAIGEVEVVATQDSCDVYLHTKLFGTFVIVVPRDLSVPDVPPTFEERAPKASRMERAEVALGFARGRAKLAVEALREAERRLDLSNFNFAPPDARKAVTGTLFRINEALCQLNAGGTGPHRDVSSAVREPQELYVCTLECGHTVVVEGYAKPLSACCTHPACTMAETTGGWHAEDDPTAKAAFDEEDARRAKLNERAAIGHGIDLACICESPGELLPECPAHVTEVVPCVSDRGEELCWERRQGSPVYHAFVGGVAGWRARVPLCNSLERAIQEEWFVWVGDEPPGDQCSACAKKLLSCICGRVPAIVCPVHQPRSMGTGTNGKPTEGLNIGAGGGGGGPPSQTGEKITFLDRLLELEGKPETRGA